MVQTLIVRVKHPDEYIHFYICSKCRDKVLSYDDIEKQCPNNTNLLRWKGHDYWSCAFRANETVPEGVSIVKAQKQELLM